MAHDGARLVDLTAIGVEDMFDALARAHELRRVAPHLLHSPGAIAYGAGGVRLVAPLPYARSAWRGLVGAERAIPASAADRRTLPVAGAPPVAHIEYVDPEPILGPLDTFPPPERSGADAELAFGLAGVLGGVHQGRSAERPSTGVVGFTPVLRWAGRTAMGPWLVTADELAAAGEGPAPAPAITLAIGGAVRYRESWADEAFAVVPVHAAASAATLRPGDVLCAVRRTGPPAPSEEILLNVERLGALAVRAWPAATDLAATPTATAE